MTDEPPSLVDSWLAKSKAEYPIVCLKNGDLEDFLGVKGFPHAAVIDPNGLVAFSGIAYDAEGSLDEALDDATEGPLWPKKLDDVAELLEKDPSKAYAKVLKLAEDSKLDETETAAVAAFRAHLESLAESAFTDGTSLLEQGLALQAMQRTESWAAASPAFPATPKLVELRKEIEALPTFKAEMRAGEIFAKAEVAADETDFETAAKTYKLVYTKYDETRIAAVAQERAKELVDKGLPGFKKTCLKCKQAKRACEKHAVEIKL